MVILSSNSPQYRYKIDLAERDTLQQMSGFYFSPSKAELQDLGLSAYETYLLSRLVQTLRLGVYMSQKRQNKEEKLDDTHPGAVECEVYVKSAFSSGMLSDRLFPLRLTGMSMQFILQHLPMSPRLSQLSAKGIFQLCVWRTFAFGNIDYLREITLESDKEPDLGTLNSTIKKWGNGQLKLPVPAYGQLQIIKARIPEILSSLWELSQEIKSRQMVDISPTFSDVHELLVQKKIPSIPRHGLIAWVLTSDFFEYGLCQPPTIQALAEHITNSGASGPKGALKIIADETGQQAPESTDQLAKVLGTVFELLQNPPSISPRIGELAAECKIIQGRDLTVVDLEHALCKISRQNTRARAGKKKNAGGMARGLENETHASRGENMEE